MALPPKEQKALTLLAEAFNTLCPDEDRDAVFRMTFEALKDEANVVGTELCQIAAGMIIDGLRYGNWPSEIRKMREYRESSIPRR